MLEKITKYIASLFGIIAGSLSGISAILIAIGYLAERSHLKMLGFTNIPVDLNQYLYTGANLLGFLPGIIIVQCIPLVMEPFILIMLITFILARFSVKYPPIGQVWSKFSGYCIHFISKYRAFFLILFVFVQIYSLFLAVKAVLVENLLFSEMVTSAHQKLSIFNASPELLKQNILLKTDELPGYFTQLFLITLFIGLALRYLMSIGKENLTNMTFHVKFWLAVNFIMFATQVILIPSNYGVLLLNNKYHEVRVQFNDSGEKVTTENKNEVPVLNNRPPELVNSIRDQRLEVDGFPFKFNMEASPRIFFDPDGDKLSYTASTNEPDAVEIVIDRNLLIVNPLQVGEASINLEAHDKEGRMKSTSFNVSVEDEIFPVAVKVADPIEQVTLVVGEDPYVRDLMAEPAVFRVENNDQVNLTFQASISSADIADVNVTGHILKVQPVSKGTATITVTANDGLGHLISVDFNVVVLEKDLSWPEDDRLLLLYQSDDVFYLYSRLEKRIWYVRSEDIESMVYYGLTAVF